MTLEQVAAVVGGRVEPSGAGGVRVTAPAGLDSRAVEPGGLFVALAGARADGHDHAPGAVAAGAAAVLGSRPTGVPTVVVDDVVAALGVLARHVRDALPGLTVLAMTGSQGKTGTKDYLAQVLARSGPTVATAGNLNNELGVPLTVLRADPGTRFLVVEMGARGLGHVADLCRTAGPDHAAVLNVGKAHVGEFGGVEAIAQAKGEIVEALGPEGTAVLNAEDPRVAAMAPRTPARVVTFGIQGGPDDGPAADVVATDLVADDLDRHSFVLRSALPGAGDPAPVRLAQPGRHQVANAAAAAALALAAGLDLATVAEGLTAATAASPMRMALHERADGAVVVDDAYNANPAAVRAALGSLVAIAGRRGARSVAVLGEMRELGPDEAEEHRSAGAAAAAAGVDVLVAVGAVAASYADGAEAARTATGWTGRCVRTADRGEAVAWVRHNVAAGDVVLVKASRGAALEHVTAALLDEHDHEHAHDDEPDDEGATR